MPPKKKAAPSNKNDDTKGKKQTNEMQQEFMKTNNTTHNLHENQSKSSDQQVYLQDIKRFDKAKLKRTNSVSLLKKYGGNDDSDITASGSIKQVTLNQDVLCFNLWKGQAYPVHEIKAIDLLRQEPRCGLVFDTDDDMFELYVDIEYKSNLDNGSNN